MYNTMHAIHNQLKRGKNSNFKCVFGWLHVYPPQILNSCFFEIFSSLRFLFEHSLHLKFFQKTFMLAFEANSIHSPAKMEFFPRLSSLCNTSTFYDFIASLLLFIFFDRQLKTCRQIQ